MSEARVGIGEFRNHVSEYVRRAEHGETIVILNRDREVAVLSGGKTKRVRSRRLLGALKGTAEVVGDLAQPIPAGDWFQS